MRLPLALALVAASTSVAAADDAAPATAATGFRPDKGVIGVGIVLGEPTGICAKLYLADDRAIAVAAGGDFISGGLQITGDYLFHPYIVQTRDSFVMPFYVGPGVRLMEYTGDHGYFATGLRAVAGLAFDFKEAPIDAFVEIAGLIETGYTGGHGFGASLNAGAGVRYYF